MAVVEQNRKISGVQFHKGFDVTSDFLNAMQQYLSTELADRTKDFIQYPGFAYGLRIGGVNGMSVTVTAGVGYDGTGQRLYHPSSAVYKVGFPTTGMGSTFGYFCVKAYAKDVSYRIHPYSGERLPVETAVGLEFFVDTANPYADSYGNSYPSSGEGLIIAKLTVLGAGYDYEDTGTNRSPFLKLRDGL